MAGERVSAETDAPESVCNCSLGWRHQKGSGPDPARCPIHGEVATSPEEVTP